MTSGYDQQAAAGDDALRAFARRNEPMGALAEQADAVAGACHAMAVRFHQGGKLAGFCTGAAADHVLLARSGDPRVVKEMHVTMYHLLWELVHVFFEQPGALSPGVVA